MYRILFPAGLFADFNHGMLKRCIPGTGHAPPRKIKAA